MMIYQHRIPQGDLDHEVELWDGTTGRLVAWVRIPHLASDANSTIYAYYGHAGISVSQENPTAVWDAGYAAVWHFGETAGGTGAIRDSTANGNHGTDVSSPTLGQPGQIGRAVEIDDTDNYVQVPHSQSLRISDQITVEAWVYNEQIPDEETILAWGKRGGPNGSNMSFGYGTNGNYGAVGHWGAPDIGWGTVPGAGQWRHLAHTYDGITTRVYADGVLTNTESIGPNGLNIWGENLVPDPPQPRRPQLPRGVHSHARGCRPAARALFLPNSRTDGYPQAAVFLRSAFPSCQRPGCLLSQGFRVPRHS